MSVTYKLVNNHQGVLAWVDRSDGVCIPIDSGNTDYANFKAQILADEAQLQDADGNVMSADEAKEFVKTLP